MKNYITLTFSLFLIVLSSCKHEPSTKYVLSPEVFSQKISQLPTAPILDVRTPEEYGEGHLINSTNVDWNGSDFMGHISQLDKSKPVFVYCKSGGRSEEAAKKMRSEGFKEVYELSGGTDNWEKSKLPETLNTTRH